MKFKRVLCIFLMFSIFMVMVGCSANQPPKDKSIIGTWRSDFGSGSYQFKSNGKVILPGGGSEFNYTAENGELRIDMGRYGDDFYHYQIILKPSANGQVQQQLVLWKTNYQKAYYTKVS